MNHNAQFALCFEKVLLKIMSLNGRDLNGLDSCQIFDTFSTCVNGIKNSYFKFLSRAFTTHIDKMDPEYENIVNFIFGKKITITCAGVHILDIPFESIANWHILMGTVNSESDVELDDVMDLMESILITCFEFSLYSVYLRNVRRLSLIENRVKEFGYSNEDYNLFGVVMIAIFVYSLTGKTITLSCSSNRFLHVHLCLWNVLSRYDFVYEVRRYGESIGLYFNIDVLNYDVLFGVVDANPELQLRDASFRIEF
jgi:hypothetical protein